MKRGRRNRPQQFGQRQEEVPTVLHDEATPLGLPLDAGKWGAVYQGVAGGLVLRTVATAGGSPSPSEPPPASTKSKGKAKESAKPSEEEAET